MFSLSEGESDHKTNLSLICICYVLPSWETIPLDRPPEHIYVRVVVEIVPSGVTIAVRNVAANAVRVAGESASGSPLEDGWLEVDLYLT